MIRLSDGTMFDDAAAECAYARAERRGLVRHYAPGLRAQAAGRFPEPLGLKPTPAAGLAGLIFGKMRGRK